VTAWDGPGHRGTVSVGLDEGADVTTVTELAPVAYVGIDWASEEHAVCVLGTDGRKTTAFKVAHSRDGLEGLANNLSRFGSAGRVPRPFSPTSAAISRLLPWSVTRPQVRADHWVRSGWRPSW
jgi:Transposase